MKRFGLALALVFVCAASFAQWTPWIGGWHSMPNAPSARNYLGVIAWTNGAGLKLTYNSTTFSYTLSLTGGGGSGSVTNFSAGNLSPLFSTSVANPTTNPSLSFTPVGTGSSGDYYGGDNAFHALPAAGSGTVTNFQAGNLSPLFTTSVSSSTTYPSLTFAQVTQTSNTVFAGPVSGAPANPTFRALVANDLPVVPESKGGLNLTGLVGLGQVLIGNGAGYAYADIKYPILFGFGTGQGLYMDQADATHDGWLSSNDWSAFNLKLDDAPSDGNIYGRQNAAWVVVSNSAPGLTNAVQLISSNNTTISATLSNLHFWSGTNMALVFTNRDSGNVDVVFNSTASGGGSGIATNNGSGTNNYYTNPSLAFTNGAGGGVLQQNFLGQVQFVHLEPDGSLSGQLMFVSPSKITLATNVVANNGLQVSGKLTNDVLTASKLVGTDTDKSLKSIGVGTGLAIDGSDNLYVTGGAVLTNTDQLLTAQAPDSSGSNTWIDFSIPMRYWTGTGAIAFRYSTNWPATNNGRLVHIWVPPTNYVRTVYVFDSATNWATAGFTSPMIIPGGVGSVIKASSGPEGETNVFVSWILGNKQIYNSEVTFNPAAVPGLVLWLEGGTGLYQTNTPADPTTNGAVVQYWTDISGSANHVTNAFTTLTWSQFGAPNNHGCVHWQTLGTANAGLRSANVSYNQENNVFLVLRDTIAAAGTLTAFIGTNNGTSTAIEGINHTAGVTLNANAGANLNSATNGLFNTWYLLEVKFNGASSQMWTNTVSAASGNAGSAKIGGFTIGSRGDFGATSWQGDIAEVLVYNSALTTQSRTNIEVYLGAKYSLF